MKNNSMKKLLSFIGCMVLIAAMALMLIGCGGEEKQQSTGASVTFTLKVRDLDGTETEHKITTGEKKLGAALVAEGIVEGEESSQGLYIKKVNGIEAIWENDGTYWAFYINGEYATIGVDSADITEDAIYMLAREKG